MGRDESWKIKPAKDGARAHRIRARASETSFSTYTRTRSITQFSCGFPRRVVGFCSLSSVRPAYNGGGGGKTRVADERVREKKREFFLPTITATGTDSSVCDVLVFRDTCCLFAVISFGRIQTIPTFSELARS